MTLVQLMSALDRVKWENDAHQDERVKSGMPALHALVKARAYLDLAKVSMLDALVEESKEQNE